MEGTVPPPARSYSVRRFLRHFLEMVSAMVVGMFGLGAVAYAAFWIVGVDYFEMAAEPFVLTMAFNMWAGMAVWMRHRRHAWKGIAEMGGAMFAAFGALFPLFWLGAISEDTLYGLGHVLMLPAMLGVMIHRRHEYVHEDRGDERRDEEKMPSALTSGT